MKSKNLAEYATDSQEKQQLKLKGGKKSKGSMKSKTSNISKAPKFETTGGKDPLVLNKRKGKTY